MQVLGPPSQGSTSSRKAHTMSTLTSQSFKLLLTAAAALALVACGKSDDRTVGQQLDSTIAKVEQKAEQARAEAKPYMAEAKADAEAATDKMADKVEAASERLAASMQDAGITASVNAELAKDDKLSALKINVDTSNGAVRLEGTAPDTLSRDRATRLAAGVKGVVRVDNNLVVSG